MALSEKQFKALCDLRLITGKRLESASTKAMRDVLVDDVEPLVAAERHNLTHQAVYLTLGRSREYIQKARILAGVEQ